jgi:predicted ATP-grasp superfamily ATP-dependent carboligase
MIDLPGKEVFDREASCGAGCKPDLHMKVLVAEYTVFHDPDLAPEGEAMLRVLEKSFTRCGHEVLVPEGGDFAGELASLAKEADAGLVIAPDHLLSRFTKIIEDSTHNLGCGSLACAVCANKKLSGRILQAHGISVPAEQASGLRVIKEVSGCGTRNMRISEGPLEQGEFGQQFIDGEHFSISVVGSRVVGEACLYATGIPPLPLALNHQHLEIVDGVFHYRGGETPANHPRQGEIFEIACRTVSILGCQGYIGVDVVVGDQIYVVDVNPRFTTSITGIAAIMEEEIADLIIGASKGILPERIHLRGRAVYDAEGRVRVHDRD